MPTRRSKNPPTWCEEEREFFQTSQIGRGSLRPKAVYVALDPHGLRIGVWFF
ncbi:uncharacterized protein DNG_01173 [Cephalotrichum gorgonifer]|uniref:Uncharacterized protein n=1 Tax=Cephalotrichum gorgonifer TaxID=2041049 RepID=A0AAE8MQJ0_9PEZI|nr:uncharacterized protein DNG_01173 [Cephalotrichum gorgonifer]